ncbi:MAG: sugar phosphate isomerase/epimerase [Burkholderiales bacterium]|nr:sugar phosphate isomerase/epimerase [Burkholderiales bacterium]
MIDVATLELGIAHLPLLTLGPHELITAAARAGYRRVGLRMHSAAPGTRVYPVAHRDVAPLRAVAHAAGVEIFDAEFISLTRDLDVDGLDEWMAIAAELGAQRVNCGASGDDPDVARNVERFGALCDVAARHGLAVDLEFMRWRKPIASIGDAVDIVTRAARPNGHILVDLLHVVRSGGTAADLARVPARLIGHVQLSDAPLAAPTDAGIIAEAREGRLPPGEGGLPLVELMNALPAGVPLSTEAVTTGSLPDLSPLDSAIRAHDGALRVLAQWQPRSEASRAR